MRELEAQLTAFSLALAVCDALQPNVTWCELDLDNLVGTKSAFALPKLDVAGSTPLSRSIEPISYKK
jgi:hypothetical protein